MCPSTSNPFWQALAESQFNLIACRYYYQHLWINIILLAVVVIDFFVLARGWLRQRHDAPISPRLPGRHVAGLLFSLVIATIVVIIVLYTYAQPDWLLAIIESKKQITLYSLSPKGAQFVLDALDRVAIAGFVSFLTVALVTVDLIHSYGPSISWFGSLGTKMGAVITGVMEEILQGFKQPTKSDEPKADAASTGVETGQVSVHKFPKTEWTIWPLPPRALNQLMVYYGTHTELKDTRKPLPFCNEKFIVADSGTYIWIDREPRPGDFGYQDGNLHLIYYKRGRYWIKAVKHTENGEYLPSENAEPIAIDPPHGAIVRFQEAKFIIKYVKSE